MCLPRQPSTTSPLFLLCCFYSACFMPFSSSMAHGALSSPRLHALEPNSSSSSSSSSDFEFTVALAPSSTYSTLCPADELFYKGQLLPLHLSPRISMVRTLLLSSSSTSSSDSSSTTTTATASRDSTSSSSSDLLLPDSSRPSSATADEDPHPLPPPPPPPKRLLTVSHYFSSLASRFLPRSSSSSKRSTPKEVFKKYVKKVKPLFSKKSDDVAAKKTFSFSFSHSQSFSGNLACPRRRTCAGSCPSSMRSSPSHSGLLYAGGTFPAPTNSSSSSMEELQSAIQGAIAHCKSSMVIGNQKKGFCSFMVSGDNISGA